ncbi:hypothetical protein ACO0LB_17040 [Undibacterium sp. SXout7W]|uniref:hypothetical protein n=1 Tax=Undibacterium sp. SXout7W TaxID=3413049 RepID=UPI003BF3FC9B
MFKFNSRHGESNTASMHDLMVQEPMAPDIYAQVQAQRRKARQLIEAAKDQRFYHDRNYTYE